MYLSSLKLWNFRRFGEGLEIDSDKPFLEIEFKKGINVLVGENDSGKTAIVDAIKLVLKTHAGEWIHVEEDDFFNDSKELKIELIIKGFKDDEAAHFIEWLGWDSNGNALLRLVYGARREGGSIIPVELSAGEGTDTTSLSYEAKEFLKITYLKPLRDAANEMSAKKNSRVSQILQNHELMISPDDQTHELVKIFETANGKVDDWFSLPDNKTKLHDVIDGYLKEFTDKTVTSSFEIAPAKLKSILEKISIVIKDNKNLGLGTLNRLYMAVELLHLQKQGWTGLKLCLIEELEAHLHPQAQMKVIEALQKETGMQFILTTHSPNLTSKLNISDSDEAVISLCKNGKVYPLWSEKTILEKKDYAYLKHFLDVTKSNMFFAKGVILVEGWAEEILLPVIARKMGKNLSDNEISIVNVGSTAYLHFAKIYCPHDGGPMDFKVSIVTDLDVQPVNGMFDAAQEKETLSHIMEQIDTDVYTNIEWCVAKQWTLEWCLYKSPTLGKIFKQAVKKVHPTIFSEDAQFERNLTERLQKCFIDAQGNRKTVASLDKVSVAQELAMLIEKTDIDFSQPDDYIEYIKQAINHVC